jgi:hypothetical protein
MVAYTTATGSVVDANGRSQYVNRNDAQGIPGTLLDAVDLNQNRNTLVATVEASGQTPDAGNDDQLTNSILALSSFSFWSQDLANAIKGYPLGAAVRDADGGLWVSTAVNNMTKPGAEGATWKSLLGAYITGIAAATGANITALAAYGFTGSHDPTAYLSATTPIGLIAVPSVWYLGAKMALMTPQGWTSHQSFIPAAGQTVTISSTPTFTVPGKLFVSATTNLGSTTTAQPASCGLSIALDGNSIASENSSFPMAESQTIDVAAGTHTISLALSAASGSYSYHSVSMALNWLFLPYPS